MSPASGVGVPLLLVGESVTRASGSLGDALLVERGLVRAVGQVGDLRRPGLPEVRYEGSFLLPGLQDAHIHPIAQAAVAGRLDLSDRRDLGEILEAIEEEGHRLGPAVAVVANRLDEERLSEGLLPTRDDFDQVAPDRPVLVYRYCGHVAVANSAALASARIDSSTEDPPDGAFDRGPDGRPTGVVRETAVQRVAAGLEIPPPSSEDLLTSLAQLARLGLTGVTAIVSGIEGLWSGGEAEIRLLEEVATDTPIRLSVLVVARDERHLQGLAGRLSGLGPLVSFLGVKEFADGSLGGHTAALTRPYADRPETSGILRLDERAVARARAALQMGGRVAIHAIGDLANQSVIGLFETLLDEGTDPNRLRVEHVSLLDDEGLERLADTGATASIQPAFLPSETVMLPKRVGADRIGLAYRFRSMDELGIPLAGGSDSPVEEPSPLAGMAAARHRAGIGPGEALSADRALALFTDGAARAAGQPEPLAIGSPADITVLDRDPLRVSPEELEKAKVVATWVGGVQVHHQP